VTTRVHTVTAPRHAHVQAVIAGVQHAGNRAQVVKGAMLHGRLARPGGNPYPHRPLAVEFAVRATTYLPQAVDATCHDVIVGPAQ